MGNAFNAGGGLTAGSKQRARQYRNEIYAGRDQVSALISDMLNRQLSNISSQGANTTALAMQANARGGQSLTPGAVDTSGAQGFLAALPALLQAQAQAYGQAEAGQINNTQDFLNNLLNYNQLRSTRKQPGFLRQAGQMAIAGLTSPQNLAAMGTAFGNLFGGSPQTSPTGGPPTR